LDTLKFDHRSRFAKFCVSLAGEALGDESKAEAALTSGAAYEAAKNWLTAQGAPAAMFEDPDQVLPKAGFTQKLFVHETGWVESFDAGKIGQIVVDMGGGRQHKGDTIDLGVGVEIEVEIGEELTENELIAVIHARNQAEAEAAATALREALIISKTPTAPLDPILSIH
jgi:thymidine phosphorylase